MYYLYNKKLLHIQDVLDYYTMAMAQSSREAEPVDYTSLIADLKQKCNYDGVKVQIGDNPVQYKKEM